MHEEYSNLPGNVRLFLRTGVQEEPGVRADVA